MVLGLSPCADWSISCKHFKPQKWFGIDHHSPLPSQTRAKPSLYRCLIIQGLSSQVCGRRSMAGLASSPLSAHVPGLLCVCHQFPGPFLIPLFFSCFLSQEELCKVRGLKDSCTALCCAVLGAYLSLKRCILILSLLFWLLLLQEIGHAL